MNQKIGRFEIIGLLAGALIGAAVPWLLWIFSAQHDSNQWLFWGLTLKDCAYVTAVIGASVGTCFGHAIRNTKFGAKR